MPSYSIGFCVATTANGDGSAVGDPVDGHLLLLHRLEQGRLGLRRGAVDLVSEHEVREDGSRAERQLAAALVEDPRTRHVGRHEVGRELDAGGLEAEDPGEGAHDEGLREPGHVLEQHVAAGQDADQDELMASRLPTTARSTSATTSLAIRATSAAVSGASPASCRHGHRLPPSASSLSTRRRTRLIGDAGLEPVGRRRAARVDERRTRRDRAV